MSAQHRAVRAVVMLVCITAIAGCRSRLGGPCTAKSDCALGLYCDPERKVCDDRGKLLKKQAEALYVYPIPPKQPTGVPPKAQQPTPKQRNGDSR